MQATVTSNVFVLPVERSAVERGYLHNYLHYQKARQTRALKLRRQFVRRRAMLTRRLQTVLNPALLAELNLQVVLDHRFLRRPDFVAVFEYAGSQWTIAFQSRPFGGRWFFRSSASSRLYSCSFRHLETQLCYALGHSHFECSALACA